ncbi:MAG: hypothetical protein JXC32_19620 [Anaerolineae bacterium]|nr:hypothetical protein [Anaerolineae bacterium]
MHWLLSVPETFSLREVIRRSGWLLIPSLHGKTMGDHLYRVEDLGGTPVKLDIYQAPSGLVVQADPPLSGAQVEEASQKVWRMLRLDESLQPFLRAAFHTEGLRSVRRNGARLLRGTTFFEDVLTAALATWDARGEPHFSQVARLVDHLGVALPRNPTLHAFPDAERVLMGTDLLIELFGLELAEQVRTIAAVFELHKTRIEMLGRHRSSLDELETALSSHFHLSSAALSLLLLSLGRYDHIPTNEAAIRRLSYATGDGPQATTHDLLMLFGHFQPWGGLAYWLWDWSKVPQMQGS